jgi:hypothetical protein
MAARNLMPGGASMMAQKGDDPALAEWAAARILG